MKELLLSELVLVNQWVPISFIYRRRLHDAVGLYRDDLPVVGDWEFNLRVLAHGADIRFLADEPLANWHQRPGRGGADGNSVIAAKAQHRLKDALVRDEFLREYIVASGPGLPLLLTRLLDEQHRSLMHAIERQNAEIAQLRRLLDDSRWHVRLTRRLRRIRTPQQAP